MNKEWKQLTKLPTKNISMAICDNCELSNNYDCFMSNDSKYLYYKCTECNTIMRHKK